MLLLYMFVTVMTTYDRNIVIESFPPSFTPDADKLEKVLSWKEGLKRVPLGRENLPSICFYTLANAYQNVSAVGISEDSSLLAAGEE